MSNARTNKHALRTLRGILTMQSPTSNYPVRVTVTPYRHVTGFSLLSSLDSSAWKFAAEKLFPRPYVQRAIVIDFFIVSRLIFFYARCNSSWEERESILEMSGFLSDKIYWKLSRVRIKYLKCYFARVNINIWKIFLFKTRACTSMILPKLVM